MALAPVTSTGPTITVSTAKELSEAYSALSNQPGGGSILLEPGEYGTFYYRGVEGADGNQPVVIASADSDHPASLDRISLRDVANLRFENIVVDGPPDGEFDLWIKDSENIQIVDSVFQQDQENILKDAGGRTDTFSHIRDSDNILFEGNLVDGYFHALQVTEVSGIEIINNELTNIMGDGFRGGGLQDLVIDGNYFHDFYGTDQNVTHSDLIQLWGSNAYTLTENVTITGNILMTSEAASQSIFIRNEEFGDEGDPTSGYLKNFTITDNVIYNSHRWGIHLDNVDGALIDNNTLLWNPDAVMLVSGTPYTDDPEIFVRNSLNITVTDNIAGDIYLPEGSMSEGNEIVTFTNPLASNYVGKHFNNALEGSDATFDDLFMLSSSPWYGVAGSGLNVYLQDVSDGVLPMIVAEWSEIDQYEMNFDAGQSLDEAGPTTQNSGYTYHWTFDDGTTAEGTSVTKIYQEGGFRKVELEIRLNGDPVAEAFRNYEVVTKDIFEVDFEEGLVDLSDGAPELVDNGVLTISENGKGYLIGDGNKLEIGRDTHGLYELDTFGLALDLTPTGDEPTGTFLELYQTMRGYINSDGTVGFSLTTDEGDFSLVSREPVFDDGETHRIGIAFDGNTGQLEMFADGESVSSIEAWGTTPPELYYGLVFGRTFKDSIDAIIDNIEMNADPRVAGTLPEANPRVEPPEEEVPPVEPPVEVDPPTEPPAEDVTPVEPTEDESPPTEEDNPPVIPPQDPRGTPPEAVEADGSVNFLSKILDMFLSIFGLGKDGGGGASGAPATVDENSDLDDLIPIVGTMDDASPEDTEVDDPEFDLAA